MVKYEYWVMGETDTSEHLLVKRDYPPSLEEIEELLAKYKIKRIRVEKYYLLK